MGGCGDASSSALVALPLLSAAAAAATGVKSSGDGGTTATSPKVAGGSSKEAAVVRHWADSLRHGDLAAAAKLFALPSKVAERHAAAHAEDPLARCASSTARCPAGPSS